MSHWPESIHFWVHQGIPMILCGVGVALLIVACEAHGGLAAMLGGS